MKASPPHPSHPGYKIRPAHQVLPQDIQCVYESNSNKGGIYIGNLQAAQNIQTLQKHKIGSLLTACKNIHIKHPKEYVPYTLYIPGEDHKDYDLSMHFETAVDFIHQSRKQTNILVHCMAGISRSATLVIAYLMKYMNMSMTQAFTTISSKRRKINPNPGFMKQLQRYQSQLGRNRYNSVDRQNTNPSMNNTSSNFMRRPSSHKYTQPNTYNHYQHLANGSNGNKYQKYFSRQRSQLLSKKYNPQYQPTLGISLNYNYMDKTNNKFSQSRHNRSTHQPFTNINNIKEYNNYSTTLNSTSKYQKLVPESGQSVNDLSRNLDQRINKIKQKYYQSRKGNMDNRMLEMSKVDRMSLGLDFSRNNRDALRSSYYNYNQGRPSTFNYSYL